MSTDSQTGKWERPLYLRREASAYLRERHGLSYAPSTLSNFAVSGGGPAFVLIGNRPHYPEAQLDQWALNRITPLVTTNAEARRARSAAA